MKTFFYVKSMRNITVALMDVFNNLTVNRYDTSGTLVKSIPVPIKFGPMDKAHMFKKIRESGRKYYMPVPQIGIRLLSHTRNADRVVSPHDFRDLFDQDVDDSVIENFVSSFQPTPIDLRYEMKIRTESLADYSQLIENIQPYFNPAIMLRVKEGFLNLNWERNVKVEMEDSISLTYPEEMTEEDFRFIEGTISLNAEAWMYRGPNSEEEIIKYTKVFYQTGNSKELEVYSTSGMSSSATPPASYVYGDYLDSNTVYYTDIYGAETSATSGSSGTSGSPLVPPGSGGGSGGGSVSGDYIENRTNSDPVQSASFNVQNGWLQSLYSDIIFATSSITTCAGSSVSFGGSFRSVNLIDDDTYVSGTTRLRFAQQELIGLVDTGVFLTSDSVGHLIPCTLERNDDTLNALDGPGVYMKPVSGALTTKLFALDIHDNIPNNKTFILPEVSVSGTDYYLDGTELGKRIKFNDPGACTIYLLDANLDSGFHFYARNEGGGSLDVAAVGAETIDGSTSWTSPARYNHVILDKITPSFVWIVNENQ